VLRGPLRRAAVLVWVRTDREGRRSPPAALIILLALDGVERTQGVSLHAQRVRMIIMAQLGN
jgi:hypothetical protein